MAKAVCVIVCEKNLLKDIPLHSWAGIEGCWAFTKQIIAKKRCPPSRMLQIN
jgi:hypothetical protein